MLTFHMILNIWQVGAGSGTSGIEKMGKVGKDGKVGKVEEHNLLLQHLTRPFFMTS